MVKKPIVYAFLAWLYIVMVVLLIQYGLSSTGQPDNATAPVAMLSLLVLSVATMAYIFFSQPVYLYLEGDKKHAFKFLF